MLRFPYRELVRTADPTVPHMKTELQSTLPATSNGYRFLTGAALMVRTADPTAALWHRFVTRVIATSDKTV